MPSLWPIWIPLVATLIVVFFGCVIYIIYSSNKYQLRWWLARRRNKQLPRNLILHPNWQPDPAVPLPYLIPRPPAVGAIVEPPVNPRPPPVFICASPSPNALNHDMFDLATREREATPPPSSSPTTCCSEDSDETRNYLARFRNGLPAGSPLHTHRPTTYPHPPIVFNM